MFFGSMKTRLKRSVLFVLDDADEAGYFYHDLTQMLGQESVFFFPSSYRRAVKYGQRDAANEILRTEVLARLSAGNPIFIVSYPDALAELVVSKQHLDEKILKLSVGQQIPQVDVVHQLRDFKLQEVDYVYEPGQFAVRGSIIDVYSYSCEFPFRIDFFGDEIDTIRTFSIEDQLSKDKRESIEVVPELATGQTVKQCFLQFLEPSALVVMKDYTYLHDCIEKIYNDGFSTQSLTEQLEGATEMEAERIRQEMKKELNLVSATDFQHALCEHVRVEFGKMAEGAIARKQDQLAEAKGHSNAVISFDMAPQPLFHKNFQLLAQTLEDYQLKGYTLYILADSQKQQQRLKDIFASEELEKYKIQFQPVDKTIHEGFVDHEKKACFFTDHQIFDRFHKYNLRSDSARAGKMALTMKELQEMAPGDFIVHVDFGIGRFGGLVRVPTGDSYQEMIRIFYANHDIVDVSIHSLYKISKYRRGDTGEPPRLSILGSGAWDKLKNKAKKRIKDIARDLIKLYAKRRKEKGFAYSSDSYLQHELEASFLYEDTPDQSKATADVKKDMESKRPMDRLVCGDVGFGKTEVAIRAAFKAVADNKQVAVLVPTTVLAYQHFQTFSERLKDFPCRIDYISRARTAADIRKTLKDLAAGEVNILIGTHRIVGKDVKFKDLGLLIIDEEQKFGVSTKEKLRQLKVNVDTLTMTATPIPRTLQFSLMGARDLSSITTPPPNRYPVQTEVERFNPDIIREAINFEMSRNGQVFFINNRIQNIYELEALVRREVPDARIAVGHGQMEPALLEKILLDFVNYEYDVLIATSIVESGIDVPNANTIIINNAQQFGLSDLHQLRGRVGRSNRKAFCYLLSPPLSTLTAEARRRLQAIENFAELGSGIHIAMQDLDIRGAGNMLGAEQSGFIADLGYETYQKILAEAVDELKTEEFADLYNDEKKGQRNSGADYVRETYIESDLELLFPPTYIPSDSERIALYRELDNMEEERDILSFTERLKDRFGKIPQEGKELIRIVRLRRMAKQLGMEKVVLKKEQMSLFLVSDPESPYYNSEAFDKLIAYLQNHPRECNLREQNGKRSIVIKPVPTVEKACDVLQEMMKN